MSGLNEKSMKYQSRNPWKAIFLCLLGIAFGWQANATFGQTFSQESPADTSAKETVSMDLFWNVWNTIDESYVDLENVDAKKEVYGAIGGLVNSLEDPYSVFMTPEETQQFQSSLNGELEGIGAELTVEDQQLTVVAPLKNSPAETAGLLSGDKIYMVDDQLTSDMTLWEAIMAIRGEPDTSVKLTILRKEVTDPIEITITRQKIDVPSLKLSYEEREGEKLAHLAVYQFGDDTYNEFEVAVRDILLSDADGLVLDLRENGGGYLNTSIDMLSEFFKDAQVGVIVKSRDKADESLQTSGNGQLADIPLVVLIDQGSASASEIVAGALQDYQRGVLMGTQSFGKGSVQELKDLSDGSSLRLTIAKWYTPNDHSIDHTGIIPDQVVEMDTAKIDTPDDVQLDAAFDYLMNLKLY